jgi:diacylglycerol kinase family enzyme
MGFFSLMAREREYARRRFPFSRAIAFAFAASRSILFTRAISVEIRIGNDVRQVEADAVLVTINSFDGAEWRALALDGGVFEVHILNAGGLYSRCMAALSVVSGKWRQSSNLESFTGDEVTLTRRDKRRGHVTFDGEVERKAGTLAYRLLPKAIRLIAARPPLFEWPWRALSRLFRRRRLGNRNHDVTQAPHPRSGRCRLRLHRTCRLHRLGPQLCVRCQARPALAPDR